MLATQPQFADAAKELVKLGMVLDITDKVRLRAHRSFDVVTV